MELSYQKIPVEFLSSLPEGIKFVNKHGRGYLIVDEIYCPQGHDLVVESVRIHGEPSIRSSNANAISRDAAPGAASFLPFPVAATRSTSAPGSGAPDTIWRS